MYNFLIDQIVELVEKITRNFSFRNQSLMLVLFVFSVTNFVFFLVNSIIFVNSFDYFKHLIVLLIFGAPLLFLLLRFFKISTFASSESLLFHLMFLFAISGVAVCLLNWDFSRATRISCDGVADSVILVPTDGGKVVAKVAVTSQCDKFKGQIFFNIPAEIGRKLDPKVRVKFVKGQTPMGVTFFENPNPVID